MSLNIIKLEIYFNLIKQTQDEETHAKMVADFDKLVEDYANQLELSGVDEPGQTAYLESVNILVEKYDNSNPAEIVNMVNEMATAYQTR